jgi:capsule polysaccharide export protein KpsC/LpsZ
VVTFRRSGRSKEETIFLVWGAKKGGNKAYVAAKEKLDRILSESGLE